MTEMIEERQAAERKEARYDLFSSLLDANDADSDEAKLSVSELIGMLSTPSQDFEMSLMHGRQYLHIFDCWTRGALDWRPCLVWSHVFGSANF